MNTYDQAISEYTEKQFKRNNINILLNTRVLEVKETNLMISDKKSGIKIDVPYGICIWSTGNGPTELTQKIQAKLPATQTNK